MAEPLIVNVSDSLAYAHARPGMTVDFEDPEDRFPDFGIDIRVLEPGQPNRMYHSESVQESFLLLAARRSWSSTARFTSSSHGTSCTARPAPKLPWPPAA